MYCQSFQVCGIKEAELIILSKSQVRNSMAEGRVYVSRVPAGQWVRWEAEADKMICSPNIKQLIDKVILSLLGLGFLASFKKL